jgi:hypothetical protein
VQAGYSGVLDESFNFGSYYNHPKDRPVFFQGFTLMIKVENCALPISKKRNSQPRWVWFEVMTTSFKGVTYLAHFHWWTTR